MARPSRGAATTWSSGTGRRDAARRARRRASARASPADAGRAPPRGRRRASRCSPTTTRSRGLRRRRRPARRGPTRAAVLVDMLARSRRPRPCPRRRRRPRPGVGILDAPGVGQRRARRGRQADDHGRRRGGRPRARPTRSSSALATTIFHLGPLGTGAAMKLAVNTLIFGLNQAARRGPGPRRARRHRPRAGLRRPRRERRRRAVRRLQAGRVPRARRRPPVGVLAGPRREGPAPHRRLSPTPSASPMPQAADEPRRSSQAADRRGRRRRATSRPSPSHLRDGRAGTADGARGGADLTDIDARAARRRRSIHAYRQRHRGGSAWPTGSSSRAASC